MFHWICSCLPMEVKLWSWARYITNIQFINAVVGKLLNITSVNLILILHLLYFMNNFNRPRVLELSFLNGRANARQTSAITISAWNYMGYHLKTSASPFFQLKLISSHSWWPIRVVAVVLMGRYFILLWSFKVNSCVIWLTQSH